MTDIEPPTEAVEELARVIYGDGGDKDHRAWLRTIDGSPNSASWDIARDVLAAGYVHLVTHLNSLTAYERLELGDSLCREAARMDNEEDDQ